MISAPLDAEDGLLQHFDLPGFCQTDSPLRQQMNSEDDFPGYHTTTPTMTRHDDSPFFHFTTPSPFNCQRLSPCTCADGSCISCIKRAANANGTDEDAVTPTDEYPHHSGSQVALSSPASSLDILAAAAAESAARKRKISTATGNASPAAESESKRWRSEQESDDWCSMNSPPIGDTDVLLHLYHQQRSENASLLREIDRLHSSNLAKTMHITQLQAFIDKLQQDNQRLTVGLASAEEENQRAKVMTTKRRKSISRETPPIPKMLRVKRRLSPVEDTTDNVPGSPESPTAHMEDISPKIPPRSVEQPPPVPRDSSLPEPGAITTANWGGIPVYQLHLMADEPNGQEKAHVIMRRQEDSWVNATHIMKAAAIPRGSRLRILEKDVHTGIHEKIQGGYGKYQGTWVPLERALELAQRFGLDGKMAGFLDPVCRVHV